MHLMVLKRTVLKLQGTRALAGTSGMLLSLASRAVCAVACRCHGIPDPKDFFSSPARLQLLDHW